MNVALKVCRIVIKTHALSGHFSAVVSSLFYQASRLGIAIEQIDSASASHVLCVQLMIPSMETMNCEISAWTDNKTRVASEELFQAAAGIMSVNGRSRPQPVALGVDYIATLTAVAALTSLLAMAVGQARQKYSQHGHFPNEQSVGKKLHIVKLAMSSIALLVASQYIADASVVRVEDNLLSGQDANQLRPPFISKDGILFELEALDAQPWQQFWQQLHIDNQLAGRAWKAFQLRYAKAISPLPPELFAAVAGQVYTTIKQLCANTGMSISRVVTLAQHSLLPETKFSWQAGPWTFSATKTCSPSAQFAPGPLPLSGIRVLESCRRIQGPLAGHLLALLGAEVTRIEPPGGDPLRGMPPVVDGCSARFSALNRLKDVREIDIKTTSGHAEVLGLVKDIQVFLHNWAPGKDIELGLDHDTLAKITSDIIYGCASGWGVHGSHVQIPGTDFMAQAHSGVAAEIAAACGHAGGSLFTVLDSLGGAVAAQGIVAALLQRQLGNVGSKVETSLLGAAHVLLQQKLGNCYGRHPEDVHIDHSQHSITPSVSLYQTAKGLLALDMGDHSTRLRLLDLLDIKPDKDPNNFPEIDPGNHDIESAIKRALASDSAANWQELLDRARIPAARVTENLQDLCTDPRFSVDVKHASYLHILSPWSFQ